MQFSRINLKKLLLVSVLVCITGGGFILRLWNLGEQSIWIDEGYTLNGAKAVLENGYPRLESGEIYTNNLLSVYTSALMMKVFPLDPYNPWPERLPSVLFGTTSIIAIFFLVREMSGNHRMALISAFLMAFSYWEIAWSRQIRGYAACSFFLILMVFSLWRFLRDKKYTYVVYSFIFLIFAALSHWVALAFLPVLVGVVVSKVKPNGGNDTYVLVRSILFVFLVELIAISFFWQNQFIEWYGFSIFRNGLTLLCIGAVAGLLLSIFSKKYIRETVFVGVILLLPLVLIVPFSPVFHSRYLFPLVPFLFVLVSFFVVMVSDVCVKRNVFISLFISMVIFLSISLSSLSLIPRTQYWLETDSAQPDFKGVFRFISENRQSTDIIISAYPVLHHLFLNEKGLWFPGYLNPNNLPRVEAGYRTDYYVDAPMIGDFAEFQRTVSEKKGFILTTSDTPRQELDFLQREALLVYSSGSRIGDRIQIFKF